MSVRSLGAILALVLLVEARGLGQSFDELLGRIASLDRLVYPAASREKHVQFSSFDPKSRKGQKDADAWFANGDAGHFLRIDKGRGGDEFVMADIDGPGAMVRIWSANPKGILRIYLDGAAEPLIEAPMTDLLDGKYEYAPSPLSHKVAAGWNLYLPVPFARHLRVTSSAGDFYYHVNALLWPAGTAVASLTRAALAASKDKIVEKARALDLATRPVNIDSDQGWTGTPGFLIEKDQSVGAGIEAGAGATCIREIRLTDFEAADRAEALARAMVVVTIDGRPSVRLPLGLFFGCGPRGKAFETAPAACSETDGKLTLHFRLPIPFTKQAGVLIVNPTERPIRGSLMVRSGQLEKPTPWRLGAVFRETIDQSTRPMCDWNLADLVGEGRVVGAVLSIRNPVKAWWGEGDEKIYVDGETFPSIFGTGTEDYFGYAWCSPERFSNPYHAQAACDGPGNYGITTVMRWHVLDQIPFSSAMRFDMELWHWAETRVDLTTALFYYGSPETKDKAPYDAAKTPTFRDIEVYVPKRIQGALEAEELEFSASGGGANVQTIADLWSNDRQIWWQHPKKGDTLTVRFAAPVAGRYRVLAKATVARDYGIHSLSVNGAPAVERDFYDAALGTTPEFDLGTLDLLDKGNELKVTCLGTNEKAVAMYMFGLDYLRLEAAPEKK